MKKTTWMAGLGAGIFLMAGGFFGSALWRMQRMPAAVPPAQATLSEPENYLITQENCITSPRFGFVFQPPEGYRIPTDPELQELTRMGQSQMEEKLTSSQSDLLESPPKEGGPDTLTILHDTTGTSLQLQFLDMGQAGFEVPSLYESQLRPSLAGLLEELSDLSPTTVAGQQAYTFQGKMPQNITGKFWLVPHQRYLLQIVGTSGQGTQELDQLVALFVPLDKAGG